MAGRRRRGVRGSARPGDAGQSTVEFALVLPLVFTLLLVLVQVALVVRDEIRVVHAARAAARVASVHTDESEARAAATDVLAGASVSVMRRSAHGGTVEVVVEYTSPTDLPLIGVLLPDITLRERTVMPVEQ